MQAKNLIFCLVTTPLIAFSSSSVLAFSITPMQPGATNIYDAEEEYMINGQKGVTRLNPLSVTELPRGGTAGLLNLLNTQFVPNGWTFQTAANDLAGSFNITDYDAVGTPTEVGANFALDYVPQGTDPVTGGNTQLHWIQRIFNNHASLGSHGDNDNAIDASRNKPFTDPGRLFYDTDAVVQIDNPTPPPPTIPLRYSDPPHFEDSPRRPDADKNHSWNAELYLVSIDTTNPNTVTIYNGVNWGWRNYCKQTIPGDGACKDFGDAPESYKTLLDPTEPGNPLKGGPRYGEGDLQKLGSLWDKELNGQPTAQANGDDLDPPFDDEDGVQFFDNGTVNVTFNFNRPGANNYQLRAWWDINKSGMFDPNELFIDDTLTNQEARKFPKTYETRDKNDQLFNPKNFFSRFRLTWDPKDPDVKPFGEYFSKDCKTNSPTNCISHGEVEDYAPVPVPEPSTIIGLLALGTLSAASTLKRKQKPSKFPEKELEKVS